MVTKVSRFVPLAAMGIIVLFGAVVFVGRPIRSTEVPTPVQGGVASKGPAASPGNQASAPQSSASGAGSQTPSPSPTSPRLAIEGTGVAPIAAHVPIEIVAGDAREVLSERLRAAAETTCGRLYSRTVAGPTDEALAEIDDRVAGGDESFWYDGTFWVGSREDAPAAFGAVAAVQDDRGRLWLKIGTGATAKGIGLAVFETPADKSVWFEIGGVEAVACSEAGG